MESLASSEPIMQRSHVYLLSIQLCLIEKRKLFFDLGFIISILILCLMISSFKVEAPFPHVLMEARPYCYRTHEESNTICCSKQYK